MWCNSSSIPRAGSVDFFVQIWWLWRLYIHWVSPNCANMNAVSAAAVDLCIPLIVSHTIQDREIGGYNFLSSNEKSQRVYYCTDRPNASSQVNICPPCRSRHAIPAIASCTIRRIKFFILQWKISKNCQTDQTHQVLYVKQQQSGSPYHSRQSHRAPSTTNTHSRASTSTNNHEHFFQVFPCP